jgi:hypothetical protein
MTVQLLEETHTPAPMGRDCTIEESHMPFKGWLTEMAPQGRLVLQGPGSACLKRND